MAAGAVVTAHAPPPARQSFVPAADNKQRFRLNLGEIVQFSVAIASRRKRVVLAGAPADVGAAATIAADAAADATNFSWN
jgi:hypothetical protein